MISQRKQSEKNKFNHYHPMLLQSYMDTGLPETIEKHITSLHLMEYCLTMSLLEEVELL